jgi:hypothetical protein
VGRPLRLALLASLLLAASAACGESDVDRASYVRENLELVPEFPTPPGSRVVSIASRPLRQRNEPFGGYYVKSYTTFVTYLTPPETRASDLAHFYREDVEGWRRSSKDVAKSSEQQTVCYRGTFASVCVRWLTNFDSNYESGVPFQVSFNYGGFNVS